MNPIGKDKVAIGGYDVVAYFVSGKATLGDPKIKTTHNAVIYYFSTTENQEAFVKQLPGTCLSMTDIVRWRLVHKRKE